MGLAAQHAQGVDSTHAVAEMGRSRTVAFRHSMAPESYAGNQAMLRRLSRTTPHLQCKLTIGAVNDPLEAEADRVADQVMRMPDSKLSVAAHSPCGVVRRKCAACEEEDKKLQKRSNRQAASAGEAPPIVHEVLNSPGQPLDRATSSFFEPRFEADFSRVRVHTDARAADSAHSVNARAYTVGPHIVLGDASTSDRPLLAHELAHVLQQGKAENIPFTSELGDSSPFAVETARRSPSVGGQITPMLQRATKKGCVAPSFVVDSATASVFGQTAEALIDLDYLRAFGGTPFANLFFDNPLGPMSYIAFLAAHHPSLNVALLATQIALSGGVLVPDILDTRVGSGGFPELYDVKPDSPDGRVAGRAKLAALDAFMSFNSLPYERGSSYTPSPSIPIPIVASALITAMGPAVWAQAAACGLPIVTLAPKRAADGLLLYQICVEADLDCYLKVMALEALIAIVIIAALLTEGASLPETVPALAPLLGATAQQSTDEPSTDTKQLA